MIEPILHPSHCFTSWAPRKAFPSCPMIRPARKVVQSSPQWGVSRRDAPLSKEVKSKYLFSTTLPLSSSLHLSVSLSLSVSLPHCELKNLNRFVICPLQQLEFLIPLFTELVFKVKLPGGSQSLCQILTLWNLLWALRLLQQYKTFFRIMFSSLRAVCSVALYWANDKSLQGGYVTHCASQVC